MSRLHQKQKRAASRGCFAFRAGVYWDVVVMAEGLLGPRELCLTKRQAVALAYQISVAKIPRIEITIGDGA